MNKTLTNKNEFNPIKKKSNKKLLIIIVLTVMAISIIAVGIVLSINVRSSNQKESLQEQLDLGIKYLNELDYEQAIIAYETAIEIDPMSVDAYLGLADTYINMEDFEKAMEVLQNGYNATGDERLKDKIDDIGELISLQSKEDEQEMHEEVFAFEINEQELNAAIPACVVDGIYHNAYYEYDLSDGDIAYLNTIISLVDDEKYVEAINSLNYDKTINLLRTASKYNEGYVSQLCLAFENKKIYIEYYAGDNWIEHNWMILPTDEGIGHTLHTWYFPNGTLETGYFCGECKGGVFSGTFSGTKIRDDVQDDTLDFTREYIGNAQNGILVGELIYIENGRKIVSTFNEGHIEYWGLRQENDTVYITIEKEISESGEEKDYYSAAYSGEWDIQSVKSMYDTDVYTIAYPAFSGTYGSYSLYSVDENVMYYYPW